MSFRLCNASSTFQICVMSIFSDLVEEAMEIFMDDFSVYGSSFEKCLEILETVSRQEFSLKLGKMSFHGNIGYCLKAHDFCSWVRGRLSKGFYHKNSPTTYNS